MRGKRQTLNITILTQEEYQNISLTRVTMVWLHDMLRVNAIHVKNDVGCCTVAVRRVKPKKPFSKLVQSWMINSKHHSSFWDRKVTLLIRRNLALVFGAEHSQLQLAVSVECESVLVSEGENSSSGIQITTPMTSLTA